MPAQGIPYVALFRPFRSEQRYIFSSHWVAPAVWQFGQPIMPVDRGCTFWQKTVDYHIPSEPAWKRNVFGYDRIFDVKNWPFQIIDIITRSSMIIIDISKITDNMIIELNATQALGCAEKLICISDSTSANEEYLKKRELVYHSSPEDIKKAIDGTIMYDAKDKNGFDAFWVRLVSRACSILHIDIDSAPHPVPPNRIFLNTKFIINDMTRASKDEERSML